MTSSSSRRLTRAVFGERVRDQSQVPVDPDDIVGSLGPNKALVQTDAGTALRISSAPIFDPDTGRPVDLTLRRKDEVFEPAEPLADIEIPTTSSGLVRLGGLDISMTLTGRSVRGAEMTGGSVHFANVKRDTDSIVSTTMFGADLSAVLRSRLSPQTLRYRISLPLGYSLRRHGREVFVMKGPAPVARIPTPTALDAQRRPVPVTMAVHPGEITLSVDHRDRDLAYPVLVDPEMTIALTNSPENWRHVEVVGNPDGSQQSYAELFHCSGVEYYYEKCDNEHVPFTASLPAGGPFSIALAETKFPYAEDEYSQEAGMIQNRTLSKMNAEMWWDGPLIKDVEKVSFGGLRWVASGEVPESSDPEAKPPTTLQMTLSSCGEGRYYWRASEAAPPSFTFTRPDPTILCTEPARVGVEVQTKDGMARNNGPDGVPGNYYYAHPPTTIKAQLEIGIVTLTAKAPDVAELALEEEDFAEDNPAEPARTTCSSGDPVNCATGNAFEEQTDLSIPSLGPDLDFTRYFNSRLAARGAGEGGNAPGWTTSFSAHVSVERRCYESFCPEEVAIVHQDNGSAAGYRREKPSEAWEPTAASNEALLGGAKGSGFRFTLPNQETLTFDTNGRLTSEADRYGNTLRLTRNGAGLIEKATDATGRSLTFKYNSENLLASVTDPMGRAVKYTYETGFLSLRLASVTQLGTTTIRWRFKGSGTQITSIIDALGHETTFEYANGQVIKQVDPMGRVRKFIYGSREPGRETRLIEPNGSETVETFNALGEPTKLTKAAGTPIARSTTFACSPAGRLLKVTGPAGTTEFSYNGGGDRIRRKTPGGATTTWTWNSVHDLRAEVAPNGQETTYELNGFGGALKLSKVVPGLGTVTVKQAYDTKGQLISRTDPMGRVWKFGYDAYGDRTSTTDPSGNKVTKAFNGDSQLISVVSARGNQESAKPSEYTTTFTLNWLGEVTKAVDPLGRTSSNEYDAVGNLKTETDGMGAKTEFIYDADNELVKVKRPLGDVSETGYDAMGRVIYQTDGDARKTSYERDLLGQVTQVTDPLMRATRLSHSPGGNVSKTIAPDGREVISSFDAENRIKELTFSGEPTPIKFSYDSEGRLMGLSDETGSSVYIYNPIGYLTEATNGHGEAVKYEYNLAGQVIKETYPGGKSVTKGYDADGRLATVSDWLGHTFTYAYDADSVITGITFPSASGEVDAYGRNRTDEIVEAAFKKGSQVLAKLAYTRNLAGEVEKVVSAGLPGPSEAKATLDADRRLTGLGSAVFAYDGASNPTTGPSGIAKFDAAEQLTEAGGNKYTYDQVGNRRTATVPSQGTTTYGFSPRGTLNTISRAKTESVPAISDSFTYDGLGLRASATVAGSTNYFLWDKVSSPAKLLGDGRFWYVYGAGGVPLEQIAVKGEQAEYLHYDQGQNVRLVTDSGGGVTEAVTFKPYGGVEGMTGAAKTAFGFAGQYTDADTGLIYMRARYYDPATGEFISRDPLSYTTRSFFAYADGNPLTRSDPSGLSFIDDVVGFFTEENFLSESPLNFIRYYQEEIESIEDGCSYWDSVQHGLEGAGVLALDAGGAGVALGASVGVVAATAEAAELLALRYPALYLLLLEKAAALGEKKPGFTQLVEKGIPWLNRNVARLEREIVGSLRPR